MAVAGPSGRTIAASSIHIATARQTRGSSSPPIRRARSIGCGPVYRNSVRPRVITLFNFARQRGYLLEKAAGPCALNIWLTQLRDFTRTDEREWLREILSFGDKSWHPSGFPSAKFWV